MKFTRLKRYVSWNLISLLGYACLIFSLVFLLMFSLASSGVGISADIGEYYYQYIENHMVLPYIEVCKFQLMLLIVFFVMSMYEKRRYQARDEYGLRIFLNHAKLYSVVFVTGLVLNVLPFLILSWAYVLTEYKLL